jgi:fructose-1,6-bisphosphatase II / sedoheptulose-1,7-bisphosphatase
MTLDRNLALEAVRVTEAAALAASRLIGMGDEKAADAAAVDAMRSALNSLHIQGRVVIGEGERDEAPMLYLGEQVGQGRDQLNSPRVDIALDPLEGTTITAQGGPNAMAVLAFAESGGFLNAPDVYMEKMAIGPHINPSVLDFDAPIKDVLSGLAREKSCSINELMVCILDRPRHQDMIDSVRAAGARITLIRDGDVSAVIATAEPETGIDLYLGTGGAPEGVLAAAALRCIGGEIIGRLVFRNADEISRAERMGITDRQRIYTTHDLASGHNVMFAATGVTDGAMLRGVRRFSGGARTHSIVMRAKTGTVRRIEATHDFRRKDWVESKN